MLFDVIFSLFGQIKIVIIFTFVLVFVTACSQPNKEIYSDSWKEDVLLAQECGLSGLTCCFDRENKCEADLMCCIDPSNPNNGYCGESCNNGDVNKFCRKEEPRCDNTAVCVNNYCVECGVVGNPCCADGCQDQNRTDSARAECIGNICKLCGSSGNPSCLGDFKCFDGNLDNGGLCHKCGDLNQPCCGGKNDCNLDLKCRLGFCS